MKRSSAFAESGAVRRRRTSNATVTWTVRQGRPPAGLRHRSRDRKAHGTPAVRGFGYTPQVMPALRDLPPRRQRPHSEPAMDRHGRRAWARGASQTDQRLSGGRICYCGLGIMLDPFKFLIATGVPTLARLRPPSATGNDAGCAWELRLPRRLSLRRVPVVSTKAAREDSRVALGHAAGRAPRPADVDR